MKKMRLKLKIIVAVFCLTITKAMADTCTDWGTNAYSAGSYKVYTYSSNCKTSEKRYMFNATTSTRIEYTNCTGSCANGYILTTETIPASGAYGCALSQVRCDYCPGGTWGGGSWEECFDCPSGYDFSDNGATQEEQCYRQCTTSDITGAASFSTDSRYYYDGTNECTVTKCSSGYYLSSGTCVKCPTSYPNSSAGATSASSCYKTCYGVNGVSNGKMYNNTSNTCLATSCLAGYYLSGSSCMQCPKGTYKTTASTATSCSSTCPSSGGIAGTTDGGAKSVTECYIAAGALTWTDTTGEYSCGEKSYYAN